MEWITTVYWMAVGVAWIFSTLLTWQAFEHRRFVRSRAKHQPPVADQPRRTALFVPCKGLDADLEDNLRPLFLQDHDNYELVFIVESETDPAASAIRRVMREHPHISSRLVVAGLSTTTGQKVHNLLVATEQISPDVEVLSFVDADVRPPRNWLRNLTRQLNYVSVTTGYRYFVPKQNTFANLSLTSINGAVIPIMFPGKHHLIWGGSWAINRETFERCDLREAWKQTLSDDLIATRVMAQLQERVAAEPMCILPSPLEVNLRELFSFVRRQLIIGRCYVPVHWYALLLGSGTLQSMFWGSLAAGVVGLVRQTTWAWQPLLAVGVLYALHVARASLRHQARKFYLKEHSRQLRATRLFDTWLGPLAGMVGLLGLLSSALRRRIVWKGIAYDMRPGGEITTIVRPPTGQGMHLTQEVPRSERRAA